MTIANNVYQDDFSQEVFGMFEQKYYPEDIVRFLGGTKKEYTYMYQYWMAEKRKYVQDGRRIEFVVDIEGYPTELVKGYIRKIYDNAVLVILDTPCRDESLNKRIGKRIVVSIKDILFID